MYASLSRVGTRCSPMLGRICVGARRDTPRVITWASTTDGILGAVLAGIAAFAAAAFTLSRTRRNDIRREQDLRHEEDARLRQKYVAEVITTFRALEREIRTAPLLFGRSQIAFLHATMLFYMAEKVQHPQVAQWLLSQHTVLNKKFEAWRRVWWCPVLGRRRLALAGTYLGELVGALVLWATGEIEDERFNDPDRAPVRVPV